MVRGGIRGGSRCSHMHEKGGWGWEWGVYLKEYVGLKEALTWINVKWSELDWDVKESWNK